jgi:hypothetical protein
MHFTVFEFLPREKKCLSEIENTLNLRLFYSCVEFTPIKFLPTLPKNLHKEHWSGVRYVFSSCLSFNSLVIREIFEVL